MNTFILVKNKTDQNTLMWDVCTKDQKGRLNVWTTIHDDAFYDAGDREVRNGDVYIMDFTLTMAAAGTKTD
jgi:hypothetical protein